MNTQIDLIWCHGGCFAGGSVAYDEGLRNYLGEGGDFNPVPVDFSLKSWTQAVQDIVSRSITSIMKDRPIILVGVSSGAFMAHYVANILHVPAVLIAPVLCPADRHADLPQDLQDRQISFFGSFDEIAKAQKLLLAPNTHRYILSGAQDTVAPFTRSEWVDGEMVVCDLLEDKGHQICVAPPKKLIAQRLRAMAVAAGLLKTL